MATPNAALDAAERARRTEFVREAKAACANDETPDQRNQKREMKADAWAQWLRHKLDSTGCTDPVEILPS
jgi:hypothetical protein